MTPFKEIDRRHAALTTGLVGITLVALKALCGFSFCRGGASLLENVVRVGAPALFLGALYAIGVHYLLGRSKPQGGSGKESKEPPCCCR